MREGWRTVTLGDVLCRRNDRLGDAPEPRILTVTEGNGLVDQMAHWGRRVATADVSSYKLVDPGDVVYNVYLLWAGAIGQNLFDQQGVTSPVYEVFTPTADVNARYLGLLLESPTMRSGFDAISIGSIQRRRRAPWQDFEKLQALMPPLPEQGRIVDLIGALDDAIAAGERQAVKTAELAVEMRRALPTGDEVELGDLLTAIESGVSTRPVDGVGKRVRLLSLAAVRPARFHRAEIKDVGAAALPERARLRDGDLLVTRSNTPDRVGYVCVAHEVPEDTYLPDLVWRLVPDERRVSGDYLEQVLSSPQLRSMITASASGTSQSMRKINKAGFARLRVPLPDRAQQDAYTGPLRGIADLELRQSEAIAGLKELRARLLAAFLSGEHEIPESYDELLEVAS